MKSDDPEQRIRELERELADATAGARRPRYTPAGFVPPPRKHVVSAYGCPGSWS